MNEPLVARWLPPVSEERKCISVKMAVLTSLIGLVLLFVSLPAGCLLAVGWLGYLFGGLLVRLVLIPAWSTVVWVLPSLELVGLRIADWGFMNSLGRWWVFRRPLDEKRAKPHFRPFSHFVEDLEILCVPISWDLNVAYFIKAINSNDVLVVDPADSKVVMGIVRAKGWNLTHVLTTHMHWDHSGGNKELKRLIPSLRVIEWPTMFLEDVKSEEAKMTAVINGVPIHAFRCGMFHTKDHVTFLVGNDKKALFSGDALFVGANGGLFQGDIPDLWRDITNLRRCIPAETLVFPGHTYEVFQTPVFVAPDHEQAIAMAKLRLRAKQRRCKGLFAPSPLIPSTMGDEFLTNPLFWLVAQNVPPVFKLGPKGCSRSCCVCLDVFMNQDASAFYRLTHLVQRFWAFHEQQLRANPGLRHELELKAPCSWTCYSPSTAELSSWSWIRRVAETELKASGNLDSLLLCYQLPEALLGGAEAEQLEIGVALDDLGEDIGPSTGANQRQLDLILKALECASDCLSESAEKTVQQFSRSFEEALLYHAFEPPIEALLIYVRNDRELEQLSERQREVERQIRELEAAEATDAT